MHGLASYSVAGFALPVIAGPMFIASTPDLVVAECRGGIVGAMPALNARTYSALDADLDQIERELEGRAPLYAINLVCHRSHARLRDDLAIIVRHRAPLVLLALGANAEIVAAIQGYGGRVFNDVASNRHAGKWAGFAVAAVAGGPTGSVSPFAFVQEMRAWWDGPLALAGAIATGRAMLAAETLAADFAYIGSPFLAASEGNTAPVFKHMIVECSSADIVVTRTFAGARASFLAPRSAPTASTPR